jgi:hypothetical protein
MHDRPTADELLAALESWLTDQLMPSVQGAAQYNARVAANVVRTVRREMQHEERQVDEEWRGLGHVLGQQERPPTLFATKEALRERNVELSERIRNGEADSGRMRDLVLAHLRDVVHAKLEVPNPRWLEPDTQ